MKQIIQDDPPPVAAHEASSKRFEGAAIVPPNVLARGGRAPARKKPTTLAAMGLPAGKLREREPKDLALTPLRSPSFIDTSELKTTPFINNPPPLVVYEGEDGKTYVADGEWRRQLAIYHGIDRIVTYDLGRVPEDLRLVACLMADAVEHRDIRETAQLLAKYREMRPGLGYRALGAMFRMSPEYARNLDLMTKLPADVQELAARDKLSLTAACELAKSKLAVAEISDLARRAAAGDATVFEVKRWIEDRKRGLGSPDSSPEGGLDAADPHARADEPTPGAETSQERPIEVIAGAISRVPLTGTLWTLFKNKVLDDWGRASANTKQVLRKEIYGLLEQLDDAETKGADDAVPSR